MNELELFAALVALNEPRERAALLNQHCAGQPDLRRRLEQLLEAHFHSNPLLDPTNLDPLRNEARSIDMTADYQLRLEQPETLVAGRYKLIETIGEGGMGSVWLAEQKSPIRRKVAIKLIKPGMDSKQVMARFEAERQALALMDHPNIAKVFDGGVTEQGRPYFVMEYVKGIPLTDYCDHARLSLKERLQLFMPICLAVQHAHQKGIIHRDLKPSNILICLYDGKPVPKVIDFGLAKALHHSLTEQSLHTAHGMMVGTPLYMSPEQAEYNNLDVDTRTDIYSLGVILYELLTGSTPLERQQMQVAAFNEILRLIKEVDPPKPSTRLSSSLKLPSIAAQRSIEPAQLKRLLTGDLDWIVMKALDKERSRRYDTANGLSRDLERFLNDEAVEACPLSMAYRFKKFLRRNRLAVMAVCAVAATLLIGVLAFAWQAKIALEQRDIARSALKSEAEQRIQAETARAEAQKQLVRAETQEAEAKRQEAEARTQEAEAKQQAAIAQAIAKFQTDMLATADPDQLLGDKVTVLQAMEAATRELDEGALTDQPLVEAEVRFTIAKTLKSLFRHRDAEPNSRRALEILRQQRPAGHPDIARAMSVLAMILQAQNKLGEAAQLSREALQSLRTALPAKHPDIATALIILASQMQTHNRLAEAEPLLLEALDIYRTTLPEQHPHISASLINLAILYMASNRTSEAEPLFREALTILRAAHPPGHPKIASGLSNLAGSLKNRPEEAEALYREALQIVRGAFPAKHPEIATVLSNLATLLQSQNRLTEVEPLIREAVEIDRAANPSGHPNIAAGLHSLALLLRAQKKLSEAEQIATEAIQIQRAALPDGHPDIALSLENLALILQDQNKLREAEPLFREVLSIRRAAFPTEHPYTSTAWNNLAVLLQAQEKVDEAESSFYEALRSFQKNHPADHPNVTQTLENLVDLLKTRSKYSEAELLVREHLESLRSVVSADHSLITDSLNQLAWLCWRQGKLEESIPLFEQVLEARQLALGMGHPWTLQTTANLGINYRDAGRVAEAILKLEDAHRGMKQMEPSVGWQVGLQLLDVYNSDVDSLPSDRPQKIAELIQELLPITREKLPEQSLELAGQLAGFGLSLLRIKSYAEAELLIRESLDIRSVQAAEAWTTFNTMSLLGGALLGQEKFTEAEPLLLDGYLGMKERESTIPPPGKPRLPEALDRLISLYQLTENAEAEQKWSQEKELYESKASDQ